MLRLILNVSILLGEEGGGKGEFWQITPVFRYSQKWPFFAIYIQKAVCEDDLNIVKFDLKVCRLISIFGEFNFCFGKLAMAIIRQKTL